MNHTQIPWYYTKTKEYNAGGMRWGGDKVFATKEEPDERTEQDTIILDAVGGEGAGGGWGVISIEDANAEFIVRCVNSHDALVDALEGLLACRWVGETASVQVDAAREALELARERA